LKERGGKRKKKKTIKRPTEMKYVPIMKKDKKESIRAMTLPRKKQHK